MIGFFSKKKGISIIEVVIAIAVFSIITTVSITLVTRSYTTDRNAIQKKRIAVYSEDVVECFRFSDDLDSFYNSIKKCGDFVDEDRDGVLTNGEKVFFINNDYTLEIIITDFSSIEVVAKNKSGSNVYSLEYSKAT